MTTTTWIPRQPICYALYKRVERLLPTWLKRLWPERPVPIKEVPGPCLSIYKLVNLISPFLYEPIVALWFVDEPAEYHALLRRNGEETFMDLPVYLFLSAGYTKDELAQCPAFCHEPGLWLEMEDGNHRKLEGWRDG